MTSRNGHCLEAGDAVDVAPLDLSPTEVPLSEEASQILSELAELRSETRDALASSAQEVMSLHQAARRKAARISELQEEIRILRQFKEAETANISSFKSAKRATKRWSFGSLNVFGLDLEDYASSDEEEISQCSRKSNWISSASATGRRNSTGEDPDPDAGMVKRRRSFGDFIVPPRRNSTGDRPSNWERLQENAKMAERRKSFSTARKSFTAGEVARDGQGRVRRRASLALGGTTGAANSKMIARRGSVNANAEDFRLSQALQPSPEQDSPFTEGNFVAPIASMELESKRRNSGSGKPGFQRAPSFGSLSTGALSVETLDTLSKSKTKRRSFTSLVIHQDAMAEVRRLPDTLDNDENRASFFGGQPAKRVKSSEALDRLLDATSNKSDPIGPGYASRRRRKSGNDLDLFSKIPPDLSFFLENETVQRLSKDSANERFKSTKRELEVCLKNRSVRLTQLTRDHSARETKITKLMGEVRNARRSRAVAHEIQESNSDRLKARSALAEEDLNVLRNRLEMTLADILLSEQAGSDLEERRTLQMKSCKGKEEATAGAKSDLQTRWENADKLKVLFQIWNLASSRNSARALSALRENLEDVGGDDGCNDFDEVVMEITMQTGTVRKTAEFMEREIDAEKLRQRHGGGDAEKKRQRKGEEDKFVVDLRTVGRALSTLGKMEDVLGAVEEVVQLVDDSSSGQPLKKTMSDEPQKPPMMQTRALIPSDEFRVRRRRRVEALLSRHALRDGKITDLLGLVSDGEARVSELTDALGLSRAKLAAMKESHLRIMKRSVANVNLLVNKVKGSDQRSHGLSDELEVVQCRIEQLKEDIYTIEERRKWAHTLAAERCRWQNSSLSQAAAQQEGSL